MRPDVVPTELTCLLLLVRYGCLDEHSSVFCSFYSDIYTYLILTHFPFATIILLSSLLIELNNPGFNCYLVNWYSHVHSHSFLVCFQDWRGHDKTLKFNRDLNTGDNRFVFQSDPLGVNGSTASPTTAASTSVNIPSSGQKQSSLDSGSKPLTLDEAASTIRRRCTSECLTRLADDPFSSPTHYLPTSQSPLSLSIDESLEMNSGSPLSTNTLKLDFMSRWVGVESWDSVPRTR